MLSLLKLTISPWWRWSVEIPSMQQVRVERTLIDTQTCDVLLLCDSIRCRWESLVSDGWGVRRACCGEGVDRDNYCLSNCLALRLNPFCDSPEAPELHLGTSACLLVQRICKRDWKTRGDPGFASHYFGKITQFFWASVFFSVKWRQYYLPGVVLVRTELDNNTCETHITVVYNQCALVL